jgi:hypothetical protein
MFCTNKLCPDFLETGFHAEFVDSVTKCPRCGEYLVSAAPQDASIEQGPIHSHAPCSSCSEPYEPVFETDDPEEILLVESHLQNHQIPSVTRVKSQLENPEPSGRLDLGSVEETVVFLVPRSLIERAWELLTDFDESK